MLKHLYLKTKTISITFLARVFSIIILISLDYCSWKQFRQFGVLYFERYFISRCPPKPSHNRWDLQKVIGIGLEGTVGDLLLRGGALLEERSHSGNDCGSSFSALPWLSVPCPSALLSRLEASGLWTEISAQITFLPLSWQCHVFCLSNKKNE